MINNKLAYLAAGTLLVCAPPLWAEDVPETAVSSGDVSGETSSATQPTPGTTAPVEEQIDVASIQVPSLDYCPDPAIEKDFDKYYYFHRAGTGFRTALDDLRYCDGLARGLANPYGNAQVPYAYVGTMAGALGGALGNMMASAIFGSAQVRALRRINMRRCMNFKGYQRYGLPKDIWETFNFEEGFSQLEDGKRQVFLMQQAKVASGEQPKTEALGR